MMWFQGSSLDFFHPLGLSGLAAIVFTGGLQNCLSRASKYTVFDATKNGFIPMDQDTRIKTKAAIDGVGSRLGKSGSSILYQAILLGFSTLAQVFLL